MQAADYPGVAMYCLRLRPRRCEKEPDDPEPTDQGEDGTVAILGSSPKADRHGAEDAVQAQVRRGARVAAWAF